MARSSGLSERDGWKHLYHYSADGTLKDRVTSGPWEVRSIAKVDPESGWIYFTGTRDAPMAPNLYRVKLGGPIERLTQGPGSYQVSLSPDGRHYLATWSDIETPPQAQALYSPTASSCGPWIPTPCTGSRSIGSGRASASRSPPATASCWRAS